MVILQCTKSQFLTNNLAAQNETHCIQKYKAQNPWDRRQCSMRRTKKMNSWNGAPLRFNN